MTTAAIREFINRHSVSSSALAALGATLDQKVNGTALDPALAARIQELLDAVGAGQLLDGVNVQEATPFLLELWHGLPFDSKLLSASRSTAWNTTEPEILQAFGEFARLHAMALTRLVIPSLDGLSERFGRPGAAFLDVGVGVAGLAIGMAQMWPGLRIVGIDPWQPALRLARENVDKAGLGDRIELREQGAEALPDESAFDLAWIPLPFMPELAIEATARAAKRALRPGGYVVFAMSNWAGMDPIAAAVWRLRVTQFGGPLWTPSDGEKQLRDQGLSDVRIVSGPPGSPAAFVIGRKA